MLTAEGERVVVDLLVAGVLFAVFELIVKVLEALTEEELAELAR